MKTAYGIVFLVVVIASVLAFVQENPATAGADEKPASVQNADKAAVKRAQKTVKMLDDIYKQTIVLITDKYVHDENDFAAGSAAVLLFKNISKGGSHHVRLIDATGQPYEEANVAKDAFEKQGVARLKKGDALYEEVVEIDGKPHLRTLTPVPVVMEKCVMCHGHYADAKKGEPIGAISYIVPVE